MGATTKRTFEATHPLFYHYSNRLAVCNKKGIKILEESNSLYLQKKIRTMKKEYLKPSFESLSVETVQLFAVSTRPTTVDSSESDFKEEKGIEWGEVEF